MYFSCINNTCYQYLHALEGDIYYAVTDSNHSRGTGIATLKD